MPAFKQSRNLLAFHRSETRLPSHLSNESRTCLRNLAAYRAPESSFHTELTPCPNGKLEVPRARRAAVLVAIFVGRLGDLYVLLSRRSAALRAYAGDTSLPGGKVDVTDASLEETARREAYEEIGLPVDPRKVPLLCILEPFLAGTPSRLSVVTPIAVLILDNTLRPMLNAAEVTSIFSHPLASFLQSDAPFPAETESLEVPYHSTVDLELESWPTNETAAKPHVRMHRFLTGREAGGTKPVFGLTAAICIRTAIIGFKRAPDFEVLPASEDADDPPLRTVSTDQRIAHAILTTDSFGQVAEPTERRIHHQKERETRLKMVAYGTQVGTGRVSRKHVPSRRHWFAWRNSSRAKL